MGITVPPPNSSCNVTGISNLVHCFSSPETFRSIFNLYNQACGVLLLFCCCHRAVEGQCCASSTPCSGGPAASPGTRPHVAARQAPSQWCQKNKSVGIWYPCECVCVAGDLSEALVGTDLPPVAARWGAQFPPPTPRAFHPAQNACQRSAARLRFALEKC